MNNGLRFQHGANFFLVTFENKRALAQMAFPFTVFLVENMALERLFPLDVPVRGQGKAFFC